MKEKITSIIDFFYPPFQKVMDIKTFRYLACGGGNTVLDIFIYFISYNFILDKNIVHLPFIAVSPHIAAFIISFTITFPLGFFLMRNIVFTGSYLRGRIQFIRYLILVLVCILLNYIFIKLFVEHFGIYPTVAKILTTGIIITFSYITQRNFTFKTEAVKN
jgi:putative flippase GtrA